MFLTFKDVILAPQIVNQLLIAYLEDPEISEYDPYISPIYMPDEVIFLYCDFASQLQMTNITQ